MKRFQNSGGLKVGSLATIYFARAGQYVKIGISRNPEKRVRALRYARCSAPADVDLSSVPRILHLIPDSMLRDEFAMHCLFEPWWVVGEWFRYDEDFALALGELVADEPLSNTG